MRACINRSIQSRGFLNCLALVARIPCSVGSEITREDYAGEVLHHVVFDENDFFDDDEFIWDVESEETEQWMAMMKAESKNSLLETDGTEGYSWDSDSAEAQAKFARATFAVQLGTGNDVRLGRDLNSKIFTLELLKEHVTKCFPNYPENPLYEEFEKFLESTFRESKKIANPLSDTEEADVLEMIRFLFWPFIEDIDGLLSTPKATEITKTLTVMVSELEKVSQDLLSHDEVLESVALKLDEFGLTHRKEEFLTVFRLATGISEFSSESQSKYGWKSVSKLLSLASQEFWGALMKVSYEEPGICCEFDCSEQECRALTHTTSFAAKQAELLTDRRRDMSPECVDED
eukprot:Gregarina_sp_Poly_1__3459@NODE_2000_length_2891_cov_7_838527_g1291_i0_p1_GENE_NODE_2000_length_2891_cov_7_838527_g1291_i0NODE_2000_length_2891_cov_7_838527_g1291_i0_p1_ORF_typecomplete_len347_score55_69DXP_synthase_N/PF13292_6/1_3DXP_synthase_N/PF13292_6/2_4_NODE_2000_length_2891_cov_7_838527_g1291_i01131153